MIIESIVPQSAGSLSVAVLALMMLIVQITFFFRKPRSGWYIWGAATSFASMIYAIGIFLEYNTPAGSFNRFAGLLEFTALILLVHCFYGFTLTYLQMPQRRYHLWAGCFHIFVLIIMWSTNLIVADNFAARTFIWLARPFIEPEVGALGPAFEAYVIVAGIGVIILWLKAKGLTTRQRVLYLSGIIFWFALGIHDGLASFGVPTVQYLMEYGFLVFAIIVDWGVFHNYIDISAEDKYRVITEFANDAIMVIQDGKTIFGNPACNRLIGHPVTDTAVEDLIKIIVPEDRKKMLKHKDDLLSVNFSDSLQVRIKRDDSEEKNVEIRLSSISYRNKPAAMAVIRDITERIRNENTYRETEEKLIRLKKMESLGLLAGGVAHDLNNVLAGIVSYPDILLMTMPEDSKLRKPIETMQQSGLKAAAIVQDLLTVARGVAITKEPFKLNDLIIEYLESPEYKKLLQYHPQVTVKEELDPELLNIKGSTDHVRKVLMNLISNAAEAIEGKGTVVVATMNRYIDKPLSGCDDISIGEYAVLVIADSGRGISPDDINRIFEPFYTKKIMGRSGTGLGLTVVWNIMQDHDGCITVTSDKEGTRFELYFPITREKAANKVSVPLMELYGNEETILVIDDVQSQREISCGMLETLHYKALSVSGGEEAVEYLKDHTVDLLLLDMIMDPGINGRETYARIKKIHPQQKAIIFSGFAETEQVKETQRLGAGRYIKKPLILEELGLAVKEELKK